MVIELHMVCVTSATRNKFGKIYLKTRTIKSLLTDFIFRDILYLK